MKIVAMLCILFCLSLNLSQAVPLDVQFFSESRKSGDSSYKRVVNGNNANAHEWPWQVSLEDQHGTVFCGGSIITEEWILTSAYCVEYTTTNSINVVVGEHDTSAHDPGHEKTHKVDKAISHKGYSSSLFKSDVGLLHLKTPLTFNDQAQAIQLPKQGDRVPAGTKCFITGWGLTNGNQNTSLANILQEADLEIADDQDCKASIYGNWIDVATMICAGAKGKGACVSDGGGPLSCLEKDKWVIRGVTSRGDQLCSTAIYSVFTRVSSFTDWVNEEISR